MLRANLAVNDSVEALGSLGEALKRIHIEGPTTRGRRQKQTTVNRFEKWLKNTTGVVCRSAA